MTVTNVPKMAILLALMSLPLSACTTSLVSRVEPKEANNLQSGVPYQLPVLEVDLTTTRLLQRCEVWTATYDTNETTELQNDKKQYIRVAKGDPTKIIRRHSKPQDDEGLIIPGEKVIASSSLDIDIRYAASHEVKYVGGELLALDPDAMASAFKTSSLDVTYHENTLQISKINASIEGKEAEATGAAIKLAASVAGIALGLPPAAVAVAGGPMAAANETTENFSACTEKALSETKVYASVVKQLGPATTKAAALAGQLEILTAKKEAGTITADGLKKLTALTAEAKKLVKKIKDYSAKKARLEKSLAITTQNSYFRNANLISTSSKAEFTDQPNDARLQDWLGKLIVDYGKPGRAETIKERVAVYGFLEPFNGAYTCKADSCGDLSTMGKSGKGGATKFVDGVLYRIPVPSVLLVRTRDPEEPSTKPIKPSGVPQGWKKQKFDLVFETVYVPQYGPVRSLPLTSDWGEKNNLTASFAKNGIPTAIAYKRETAPGVAALSTAGDAANALLTLTQQIEAKKVADAAAVATEEQAEIDAITRQVNLIAEQNKLDALIAGPNPDLVDLQARLALLTLQKEIDDLENPPPSEDEEQ